jgi:hypothetical protein
MSSLKNTEQPSFYEHRGKHKGIFAWILSTDHKRIGLLYFYSIMTFFLIGATIGLLMKLELIAPGKTIVDAQTYNAFFTLHGIIMIFAVVIPGLPAVFGNFMLPIMIGANDVAFPRINLLSWYMYITGVSLVLISQFTGQGPPDTGWTFYAPYSFRTAGYDTGCIRGICSWILVGSYRTELHYHYPQDAGTGNDLDENALIPLEFICHRMGSDTSNSYYWDYPNHDYSRKGIAYRIL